MLSPVLLELLHDWWRIAHPKAWLFTGQDPLQPISTRQLNRACHAAAHIAEITKRVSPHIPYFHVVFTLPMRIATVAYQNKAVIYDLLFKASSQTMLTIAADPKRARQSMGKRLRRELQRAPAR